MSKQQKDILERVKNKKSGANVFVNAMSDDSNKNDSNTKNENDINNDVNNNNINDINDDIKIDNNNENDNSNVIDTDVDYDTDNNDDNGDSDNIVIDTMNDIATKYNKKKNTKTQTGFYIDADNTRNLNNFAKKYGKGVKSELVNKLLRSFFENNQ